MAPFCPPDPFLDKAGSPPVPWEQWFGDFSLYVEMEQCPGEDRAATLLRCLGEEGRRIVGRLLQIHSRGRRTRTGTWTYEDMVSVLTAHYLDESADDHTEKQTVEDRDSERERKKKIKRNILISTAAVGGALVCGIGAVVAAPFVLAGVGFTSAGIAAGSFAASMMSSAAIASGGGVAAGSLVAVLQSAGAVGLTAGASAMVAGVGAAVGGAAVGGAVAGGAALADRAEGGGAEGGGSETVKLKSLDTQLVDEDEKDKL